MLFEFGEFSFDEGAYELRRAGSPLKVDPKVLDVLVYLLQRPGQLVTKNELLRHAWEGRALSDTVLTGTISRLRKALGDGPGEDLVVSVYGRGYRFAGAVRTRARASMPPEALNGEPSAHPTSNAPFVGRSAPLVRVEAAIEQARAGRGRIVVLAGEPGIGKTLLAEVSAERAAENGVHATWGHCRAFDAAPPFWPFTQLLNGLLRASSSEASRAAVTHALSLLMPEGTLPADWGGEASRYRVFDAVTRALQTLAAEAPWLLVLDDLQWADAASLRLLAYLAPEIAHLGLVILATARNTEPAPADGPLALVLGHRNCEIVELGRLTEAEVAEYTALRLGEGDSGVSRAVYAKSEGNPFFMVEVLRPFRRSVPPRADDLALPGPALDIVRQRIRVLRQETRSLLSVAAVMGREFDVGILSQVAEKTPEAALDLLEPARTANIIEPIADRRGHFAFGHDLIRSVLLDDLSASESARLHLGVGQALEHRLPVGQGLPRPELVHHLLSASPLGDVAKAVEYAKRSALAAAQVCAHADAAALLRRALAALELTTEPHPRLRCDLLVGLAQCARIGADRRFFDHIAEAVAIAREHGFGEVLAQAGHYMSIAPGFIALPGAREVLEDADRTLAPELTGIRSSVVAVLSWTAPYCWEREKVDALLGRAESLARESGSAEALGFALSAKLYFLSGPDAEGVAETLAHQIDVLRSDRPPTVRAYWAAQAEFSRAVMSMQRADVEGVERSIAAFGAAADELKHAELGWHYQRLRLVIRMNQGEYKGMRAAFAELRERAEQLQLFARETVCAADAGVLFRETGAQSPDVPYKQMIAPDEADCPCRRTRKIRFMAETGSASRARSALHELSCESLEKLPHDRDYLATLVNLAVVSVATQSLAHAETLHGLLAPYGAFYAADISLHCDGSVSHFLGTLARALGRHADAVRHLEEGIVYNQKANLPGKVAYSTYELGCVLREGPNPPEKRVRALFSSALDESRRMGLERLKGIAEDALRVS